MFNTVKDIDTLDKLKKKFSDNILRGNLDRIYGLEKSNIISFPTDKTQDIEWNNFIHDKYTVIVGVTLKENVWTDTSIVLLCICCFIIANTILP